MSAYFFPQIAPIWNPQIPPTAFREICGLKNLRNLREIRIIGK